MGDEDRQTRRRSDLPHLKSAVGLAAEFASQRRLSTGIGCLEQGLGMAELLTDLIPDEESLMAAVLYNAVAEGCLTGKTVAKTLSPRIESLIEATKQMEAFRLIQEERNPDKKDKQHVEKLRKMLLVLAGDIRSILIKLAERIFVLRHVEYLPRNEQQKIANETQTIYAPLANRLGVGRFKWELEDLAFRCLAPEVYRDIANQLNVKRSKREEYIAGVVTMLNESIMREGITNFTATGRVKHIFSIWRKMKRKSVSIDEIYDMRAVRILVDRVSDCYVVLGAVHSLWEHVPKEFDDYIASPKQNGYRSLHTAIVGPEGKFLEVQIRTRQMHEESELGVAAHWRYKEGSSQTESILERRIAWLRRLIERQKRVSDDDKFVKEMRSEFLQDRIYVFTPKGKILDLPKGSTPLDFAYAIHSQVGHRCRGSKVDGHMKPLTYRLKTGEQVEILTVKEAKPSRDWMARHKGYIRSSKARSYIHRWFKRQDFERNLQDGKSLLERETKRTGLRKVDYAALAKHFRLESQDSFFASLGAGDLSLQRALHAAQSLAQPETPEQVDLPVSPEKRSADGSSQDIQIDGVDNLLTVMAGCCKPVPGDEIMGYVTQGRGVSIHRRDCKNVGALEKGSPERVIDVTWGDDTQAKYSVDISIEANDRKELFNDINREIGNEPIRLLNLNLNEKRSDGILDIGVAVEVENLDSLGRLLIKLRQTDGVIKAKRK